MGKPDFEKIIKFLCKENDFSVDRVDTASDHLKSVSRAGQKTLDQWF